MTIEEALDTYLKASSALKAQVGEQIYYVNAPQGTAGKYLVFYKISDPPLHDVPVRRPRFQFSCWAPTAKQARTLANVVHDLLQRYKGILSGIRVSQIAVINDLDLYDEASDTYHVPIDAMVLYREETA